MFTRKTPTQATKLKEEIDRLTEELEGYNFDDPEYAKIVGLLERLNELNVPKKEQRRISPDVLLTVGANLAGIILILGYEKANVITSKALSFVLKSKA